MPDRDYRTLLLLRAARETGVIDALVTSANTVDEVVAETDVTERAARITVDALVEAGFLEDLEEGLEPTNKMLGFITKTDVRSIGSMPHELDRLERWLALPETMQSGVVPEKPPNWTRNRLGSMAAMDDATVRAFVTAAVHEHADADRVLDVRGGPGSYAREFARRGYEVTLVDEPAVIDVDEPSSSTRTSTSSPSTRRPTSRWPTTVNARSWQPTTISSSVRALRVASPRGESYAPGECS
ncbi:hypothetical protein [Halospeciosus flavus]|uniref:hypothetical protein n=1 Tax=Halospeciosus flavus TaxID=3032283 RepID=UPI003616D532